MEPLNLSTLSAKTPDEAAAYELLEQMRWEGKPVCPHCGSVAKHYFLNPQNGGRKTRTGKVSPRRVWKCKDCRKQFSALTGTIMEGSKIKVATWLQVMYRMCSSKNGVSSREVQRDYGVSMEAAWFMTHRIREAMRREPMAGLLHGTVIADETWLGPNPRNFKNKRRFAKEAHTDREHKTIVLSLVSHEFGEVRSKVIPDVKRETLRAAINEHVALPATDLHTDQHSPYIPIGWQARSHGRVNHGAHEYVRDGVSTNRAEGYFAQLKRSLDGTFHHISREHLARYLAQFDFLYSTRKLSDSQRMARLMGQARGRRLTYRPLTGKP